MLPLTALWLGCPQNPGKTEGTDKPKTEVKTEKTAVAVAEKPQPKKAPVEVPAGTGPVARVDGEEVSRDVFNREFVQTIERYQKARHDVKPALRERLKDNIVRRLVDAEIIRQRAAKMQVTISEEELAPKWEAHKKRYGSAEAFQSFLERAGTTTEDVRRQFENNLLREKVFDEVAKDVKADAAAIKKFYDDNKQRYDEPEQIQASHILFRTTPNASPEEKAKKKKAAEGVLAQLEKGAKFEEMAKKYGEDPTKDRGGDLGFFGRGRMVKPFEEASWPLKVGALSPLVETQFGYHIIKKTAHKKARKKPFGEVKEQIERSLVARQRNQAVRDALSAWKKEAKIELIVKGDQAIIAADQPKPALGQPKLRPKVSPNAKTLDGAKLKLSTPPGTKKTK